MLQIKKALLALHVLLRNSYLHPHVLLLVLFHIGELLQRIFARIATLLATHASVQVKWFT